MILKDAHGRSAGNRSGGVEIPDSRYGGIVEIPNMPDHSRSLAIEVCNAQQGRYELKLRETKDEAYRLTVSGRGNTKNSESLLLHHIGNAGSVRQYAFTFRIVGSKLVLRWLDPKGREQQKVEISEW
jgi:hypothetical protein